MPGWDGWVRCALIDMYASERRGLAKMGGKSEAFCRQTLRVMAQNPGIVPASVQLADAQADLKQLDALRERTARLRQLLGRCDDTELALGSDVMSTALEGCAMLKVLCKGSKRGLRGRGGAHGRWGGPEGCAALFIFWCEAGGDLEMCPVIWVVSRVLGSGGRLFAWMGGWELGECPLVGRGWGSGIV